VRALAGARLYVDVALNSCAPARTPPSSSVLLPRYRSHVYTYPGQECNMTMMVVTEEQLQRVKQVGVAHITPDNAPFLEPDVNLFTTAKQVG
jgi:hypothetical protein